jgi:hypothetical protein
MSSFSLIFQFVILIWASIAVADLVRSYRQRKVSLFFLLVFGGGACLAVVFVFLPGISDWLFSIVGISSGANGSFFLAIVVLIIIVKRQHQTIRLLKANQTEIVRSIAVAFGSNKEK